MKTIPLYPLAHGKVALVDDEDHAGLSAYRWTAVVHRKARGGVKTWYAVRVFRADGRQVTVLMHRLIMGAAEGEEIDHRDSDGLNNQRANLRRCSTAQNAQNMRDRPGSSSFKGVSWHGGERKWRATIRVAGKQLHLGLYVDEAHAARVYDAAAREHFGEFARPNFVDAFPVADARHRKSSRHRGVTFLPKAKTKSWQAFIKIDGRVVRLGTYVDETAAARAYNAEAKKRFGKAAKLNARRRRRRKPASSA